MPEIRSTSPLGIKLAPSTTAEGRVEGYASVFGGDPDQHGDVVEPGAFQASLAEHRANGTMPLFLWQHDTAEPIGVWTSVAEDERGLKVEGLLILDTQRGREAHALLKAGALAGLSIGYRVPPGGSSPRADGSNVLTAVALVEISLVSLPSNRRARVHLASKRDLEELLTKSGLPKAAAKRVAAGGWPALATDDAEARQTAIKRAAERIRRATTLFERK